MSTGRNPYSVALGLEDMDLAALVSSGKLNNRLAIMAVLVEHGAPLPLEDVASRLHGLGMGESEDRLLRSLRKAWGGSQALRKLKDGRLSLDANAPDAQSLVITVEFTIREPTPPPTAPEMPPDSVALTEDELQAGLADAHLGDFSGAKLAAIVTEATGRPMTPDEVNAYVSSLTPTFRPLGDPRKGTARSALIDLDNEGRLAVNPDAAGLPLLRARVRKLVQRAQLAALQEGGVQEWLEREDRRRLVARAEVLARRRRLLHMYEGPGSRLFVGHVDPVGRNPVHLSEPTSRGDVSWLPDCDVLIGLDIYEVVERLGIEPGQRRLVDLGPPQKTKSLGPRRPVLKLTTTRLLKHTLGNWARIASKSRMRELVRRGDRAELNGAMEADLGTLVTYYWYGARNGFLYANWDDFDMQVPAPFGEAGDARTVEVVDELVGHEVWLRLRGKRISDPPEELIGVVTHAHWLRFTIQTLHFKLQAPLTALLAIESLSHPER